MRYSLLIIVISFGLFSCTDLFKKKADDFSVARVYDNYLKSSQVNAAVPKDLSEQDSLDFANAYVQQWAVNSLILHRAELNVSEKEIDIEEQVRAYRNSLLRFSYEREMLSQLLDTVISEADYQEYYATNLDQFKLKEPVVKVSFVVLSNNTPDVRDFIKTFRNNRTEDDRKAIEDYCFQYASQFQLNDSVWFNLESIKSTLGITYSQSNSRFLRYNTFYEDEDDERLVLVIFHDYLLAGVKAPIGYVKSKIEGIIMNQRKLEVLEQMELDLFNDALKKNHLEIL